MKVLHFISGGDTGGAKTHVLTLLKQLIKIGIEVELLCIMEGDFTEAARKLSIPVIIIPQAKRYDMTVFKKISTFINDYNPDLVHCHGARANYIAAFIMRKVKAPMITTLHSDYRMDFRYTVYKQLLYMPISAFALRRFKYILAVTQIFKKMLIKRGFKSDGLFVVYNGIDFEERLDVTDKSQFLESVGVKYDGDTIYVGIAARLQAVKGLDMFIDAAGIVCAEAPGKVKFLIAGTGPVQEIEKYSKQIIDKRLVGDVYMLGHINDINSFYNAIDINTLTSVSEGFPFALLEGARLKKPTISTAVGGIVEMIIPDRTGFLIEPGDKQALADRILKLASDEGLREKFGEAFYNRAKSYFSAKKMAETHKEIYELIKQEDKK